MHQLKQEIGSLQNTFMFYKNAFMLKKYIKMKLKNKSAKDEREELVSWL